MINKKSPLVSIVMPAYNAGLYIRQAIDSIIEQSYENWELLIADDASKDDTRVIIDSYTDTRIKIYHNAENLGYQSTCNKLFGLATGDYLTFQDADDFSSNDRIEALLAAFFSNPNLGMVGSAYNIISFKDEFIEEVVKPQTNEEIRAVIGKQSPFCGATVMVKREVYQRIGLYRPFFEGKSHQDYDWAYRVSDLYESCNLKQPLYYYRQSEGGNSKKISAKRYIGFALANYLGEQRAKMQGVDDLMRGEEAKVQKYVDEVLLKEHLDDPALIYRIYAASFMYNKLYAKAREAAWEGVRLRPFDLVNFRTWFYCFRKSIGKKK